MTYYYLYQITNLVNAKIYVGVHKTTNLNDGYMGSGKVINAAIAKYGIDNFKKDILEFFDSSKAMYAKEKKVVTAEFLLREDTYNLRRGGFGGFDYINTLPWIQTENRRLGDIKKSKTLSGQKHPETAIRLKARHLAGTMPKPPSFKDKKHTAKTKQQMSDAKKGKGLNESNSQFNTMWITNGLINKKIKKDAVIPEGWNKGRTSFTIAC
jgi:hypothetical protein